MKLEWSRARAVVEGRFGTRELWIYIAINYSIALGFLVIAVVISAMDAGFSFLLHDISRAGSTTSNPRGWPFFTIFMCYAGVAMIPLCLFYGRGLSSLQIKTSRIVEFFFLVGSVGTFLVGVFPSSVSRYAHLVSAFLAFGGYGIGFIILFFSIIVSGKHVKGLLVPYTFLFVVIGGLLGTQGYVLSLGEPTWDAFMSRIESFRGTWLSISLWEWMLFFSTILMLLSLALQLSRKISPIEMQTGVEHASRESTKQVNEG